MFLGISKWIAIVMLVQKEPIMEEAISRQPAPNESDRATRPQTRSPRLGGGSKRPRMRVSQHTVGLSADCRTHRLEAGGRSVPSPGRRVGLEGLQQQPRRIWRPFAVSRVVL